MQVLKNKEMGVIFESREEILKEKHA